MLKQALVLDDIYLEDMQHKDVEEVVLIESAVYTHPWTRGNFVDALHNDLTAKVARLKTGHIVGYFVHMSVLDEAHLLTIAVHSAYQRQGLGRFLLMQLQNNAKNNGLLIVFLEVRTSNLAAIALYESCGFVQVGRRKGYYPASLNQREDALLYRLDIA